MIMCTFLYFSAATVTAVFATSFKRDFPFDPQELIVFAVIGWVSFTAVDNYSYVSIL